MLVKSLTNCNRNFRGRTAVLNWLIVPFLSILHVSLFPILRKMQKQSQFKRNFYCLKIDDDDGTVSTNYATWRLNRNGLTIRILSIDIQADTVLINSVYLLLFIRLLISINYTLIIESTPMVTFTFIYFQCASKKEKESTQYTPQNRQLPIRTKNTNFYYQQY